MKENAYVRRPAPSVGAVVTPPSEAISSDRTTILQTLSAGAPLPNLDEWEHLIGFRPPASVQRSLQDLTAYTVDWPVHRIEDAHGPINLDYYPVAVTRLPRSTPSPEALLQHVRLNLNAFVDSRIAEFTPYDSEQGSQWRSHRPINAVVHIDMKTWGGWLNPDDGSVVVSSFSPEQWIFSTIWTTGDGDHPVSGNRQFGFVRPEDAGLVFYTRGADRATGILDDVMSSTVFGAGHALWLSFQRKIAEFVNGDGGAATIGTATSARFPWSQVKASYFKPTESWI